MKLSTHYDLPFVLALAATIWCAWIGAVLWEASLRGHSTLGPYPLFIPVILAAVATLVARLRSPGFLAVLVVLFLGYKLLTGFSIGGAYQGPAILLETAVLADLALSWWDARGMREA
ncbi:MAG TPA: hypothetical protein VEW48_12790 [Thermoanaerobaculia bacterium]|nr:hypothetical protein [Thermoanaerobaculia bacterium]